MGIGENLIYGLKRLSAILDKSDVPYALAGGLAYGARVEARATVDIDIIILLKNIIIKDLFKKLAHHFESIVPHNEVMKFGPISIWRAVVIQDEQEIIIDFIITDNLYVKNAINRAEKVLFFGNNLPVVTIEDLVIMKKLAGRPQDMIDVENIYQRYQDDLDHNYINKWILKFR